MSQVIGATSTSIDTSIVVCTCSRVHLLRRALASLLAQTWAQDHAVELVVVDDGSDDGTAEYLGSLPASSSLPVTVLAGTSEGIAAARNLGFTAARGRWIASFDDDQIASPDWLRSLRQRADQTGAAAIGGALTLQLPPGSHAARLGSRVRAVLGEHLPLCVAGPYTGRNHPATNNALLRRSVFLEVGGFDLCFTEGGEDKDFFQRVDKAGHSLWFEPEARAEHIIPLQRLGEENLRWTSRRMGASDARLCRADGRAATLRLLSLRLLLTLARDLPLLALGRGNQRADAHCRLWYSQGLLLALRSLGPGAHRNSPFLRSMNFRQRNGERTASPGQPGSSLEI